MGFENEYQIFIDGHLKARTGERRRRLEEGHGQAEMIFLKTIWWPLYHQFHHLHPEYEVNDFKDGKRYLDFAYIRPSTRICFEIDGYGPHLKNISRWQFADGLDRQNQLMLDGWIVIRFSYDKVLEHPRQCQQVVQQIIGKVLGEDLNHLSLTLAEKEIIRYAVTRGSNFTLNDICQLLDFSDKPVRKLLGEMVQKGILFPSSGKTRIRSYRLSEGVKNPFFH